MTRNIALIGCGQIGSRHLQALTQLTEDVSLFAVDPSIEAREIAKQRLAELPSRRIENFHFLGEIDALPEDLSVTVIATSSGHRLEALDRLLNHSTVDHVILEKVLFQRSADYAAAQSILSATETAWVNCPRRMMACFQQLSPFVSNHGPVVLSVEGTGWGLACNAIHFIDLLAFYINSSNYKISTSHLDQAVLPSKRANYVEFSGELRGEFESEAGSFSLRCEPGDIVQYRTRLENDEFAIEFETPGSSAFLHKKSGELISQLDFEIQPQSSLTNLAAEQLMDHGRCSLTTYAESMALHLPMINGFMQFMESLTGESQDGIRIT